MKVFRSWSTAAIAMLSLVLVPALGKERARAAAPPGPYALTDLGTLGTIESAQANGINEAGQVVGFAAGRPFLWRDGVMTDLTTIAGAKGDAQAINNHGQIVGRVTLSPTSSHPALWANGAMTDLTPGLPANEGGVADAINDLGEIVGTINYWVAVLWRNGTMTNLGHLGGGGSFAVDINNDGQVVGASHTTHVAEMGPMQHAFLWQDGVMTDLGLLPGDEDSGAGGINNRGQIVGATGRTDPETYEQTYRSFLYENGVMRALPVPSSESSAGDINDSGVVVGSMRAGGGFSKHHAYIYADGVVTNLNSLIPAGSGLHLSWATGINNAGQIVGVAVNARGSYHAFLLTPVAAGTPVVNIADASVTEGHAGTSSASLSVSLSAVSSQPVTVAYSTADASASAASDYQATSGTVTFAAGETVKTISVLVNGDRAGEPNETFLVNLGPVTGGALVADGQGVATIVDDEPRISINDVAKNEGNSGTTQFAFTVSLSPASSVPVSVNYATANGSARSGEDYDAMSGSLVFSAGQTSKTVTVGVKGDRKLEGQEVFYVNLSGAAGALASNTQGTGVVRNDDR